MEVTIAFNFLCAAILYFDINALPYFKQLLLLLLLLLLNVTFPFSSKICNLGIIRSNLVSTRANSRGSL